MNREAADGERSPGRASRSAQLEETMAWVIAQRLRELRLQLGLTVGDLARRSGLSKGMLSKIENAQAAPSLSTLARLATALTVPVTAFLRGLDEERDAVFVKAGQGPEVVRRGTRAGHRYELLGSSRHPHRLMLPLLVTLREQAGAPAQFQHPGVELIHVLDGVMEYAHGTGRYRMESGDSLQFDGDVTHGPVRLVDAPVRYLSITVAPPVGARRAHQPRPAR